MNTCHSGLSLAEEQWCGSAEKGTRNTWKITWSLPSLTHLVHHQHYLLLDFRGRVGKLHGLQYDASILSNIFFARKQWLMHPEPNTFNAQKSNCASTKLEILILDMLETQLFNLTALGLRIRCYIGTSLRIWHFGSRNSEFRIGFQVWVWIRRIFAVYSCRVFFPLVVSLFCIIIGI